MLRKLGFAGEISPEQDHLLRATIQMLYDTQVGYHQFFYELSQVFNSKWVNDPNAILAETDLMAQVTNYSNYRNWLQIYHHLVSQMSVNKMTEIPQTLARWNPQTVPLRPNIEAVWEPITQEDNWQPFYDFIDRLRQ
jgi:uncharacterized protein YdiU (UPF0061 family)